MRWRIAAQGQRFVEHSQGVDSSATVSWHGSDETVHFIRHDPVTGIASHASLRAASPCSERRVRGFPVGDVSAAAASRDGNWIAFSAGQDAPGAAWDVFVASAQSGALPLVNVTQAGHADPPRALQLTALGELACFDHALSAVDRTRAVSASNTGVEALSGDFPLLPVPRDLERPPVQPFDVDDYDCTEMTTFGGPLGAPVTRVVCTGRIRNAGGEDRTVLVWQAVDGAGIIESTAGPAVVTLQPQQDLAFEFTARPTCPDLRPYVGRLSVIIAQPDQRADIAAVVEDSGLVAQVIGPCR